MSDKETISIKTALIVKAFKFTSEGYTLFWNEVSSYSLYRRSGSLRIFSEIWHMALRKLGSGAHEAFLVSSASGCRSRHIVSHLGT